MSPTQHGEVFVTDDGAETDLISAIMSGSRVFTRARQIMWTGRIYSDVLAKERRGDYLKSNSGDPACDRCHQSFCL